MALRVIVQPRASRTEIVGEVDGRLKIRLKAPPVDGAANDELLRFLSRLIDLPRSRIEIASGSTGKRKTLHLTGIDAETLFSRLESPAS